MHTIPPLIHGSQSHRIRNRSLALIPLSCWTAIAFSPFLYSRNTWIYHYLTDTWEENPIPKVYDNRSDEETWVKLPGGRVLNYDLFQSLRVPNGQFAEIFDPVANAWLPASPSDGTAAGFIPQLSATAIGFELGGALQTPRRMKRRNGTEEVFYIGATGHTARYNPLRNEWRSGPDIP